MQRLPRILTQFTNENGGAVNYLWCDIELTDDHRVEFVKFASSDITTQMPDADTFIWHKIDNHQTLKLCVYDPALALTHQDATYCLVIHEKRLYRFTYGVRGFNPAMLWDTQHPTGAGWVTPPSGINGYRPPYQLQNTDHEALNTSTANTVKAIFYQQYNEWLSTASHWLNSNVQTLYPALEASSRTQLLKSELSTLLHTLKIASPSAQSYCLALMVLLNRKYTEKITPELNVIQKECIHLIGYDYLYGAKISTLNVHDSDIRVATYNFLTLLLYHEFNAYRQGLQHKEIQAFVKSDIEACHYKSTLANLHGRGEWENETRSSPPSPLEIHVTLQIILSDTTKYSYLFNRLLERVTDISTLLYDELLFNNPADKRWVIQTIARSDWPSQCDRIIQVLSLLSMEEREWFLYALPRKKLTAFATDTAQLSAILRLCPNNYFLLKYQLDLMIQQLKPKDIKQHAMAVSACIEELYLNENDAHEATTLLQLTQRLLRSQPGEQRKKLARDYQQQAIQSQKKPSVFWQALSITMTLLGVCVATLGLLHIIPTAGMISGIAVTLSGIGFFSLSYQQPKITHNRQKLGQKMYDSAENLSYS